MKSKVAILAMALALVGVSRAQAASITINEVAGTTYYTNGFTDFSVTTGQMNGMLVTAYWTLGGVAQGPQTAAWNNGVTFTGTDFDLAVTGDTYDNDAWQLDFSINSADGQLQRLVFDGVPGNTVFDRTFGGGIGNQGTAGSNYGKDFAGFDNYCIDGFGANCFFGTQGNIRATYLNRVALSNNAPIGDVFTGFSMEFLSFGGLGEGINWSFNLDTDIAPTGLTTNPTGPSPVPEPGSMLLLGTGFFGLAKAVRRRARKA